MTTGAQYYTDDDQEHNITAADLVINAACEGVFPGGIQIRGFAVNDAVTAETYQNGVTQMGVDGAFAAGFKFVPRAIGIALLPSGSFYRQYLLDAIEAEKQAIRKLRWSMDITYPAINMTYHCHHGYLIDVKDIPDAKEVLETITARWRFKWVLPQRINSIFRSVIG